MDRAKHFAQMKGLVLAVWLLGQGLADSEAVQQHNVPADYSSIQAALEAARPGDCVQVAAGTYFENVHLKSGVCLRGAGPGVTVIDGQQRGAVIMAQNVQGAKLEGFRVIHGRGPAGGGMNNVNSSLWIAACVFAGNSSPRGNSLYNENASPLVTNCIFMDPAEGESTDAVYNARSAQPILIQCRVSGNADFIRLDETNFRCINTRLDTASFGSGMLWPEAAFFLPSALIGISTRWSTRFRTPAPGAPGMPRSDFAGSRVRAQADPVILSRDVRLTNAPGFSSYPRLAPLSNGVAMVYDDDRAQPDGSGLFYGTRQVYFATYSLEGVFTGIDVMLGTGYRPEIVQANNLYGVVYQNARNIYFDLVNSQGVRLWPQPACIAQGIFASPSLAWTGNGFGVTFSGRSTVNDEPQVWFVLVDTQGNRQGNMTQVTSVSDGQYDHFSKIAYDGSRVGIAWQDHRHGYWELYFRTLELNGTGGSSELQVTTAQTSISSAGSLLWNGQEYAIAYADTRLSAQHYQVYLARIARDGSRVLADYKVSQSADNEDTPGLAFFNQTYAVVWIKKPYGDPGPFSPTPASPVIDAGLDLGLPYNGSAPDIGAVEFGSSFGQGGEASDVYLAWVSDTGPGAPFLLSHNAGFSAFPAMRPVRDRVAVAWFDSRDGNREIYGAWLSNPSGDIHPPEPVAALRVFPNPMQHWITFSFPEASMGPVEIKVFNLAGRLVKKMTDTLSPYYRELMYDFSDLVKGAYVYLVCQDGKVIWKGKFVVGP